MILYPTVISFPTNCRAFLSLCRLPCLATIAELIVISVVVEDIASAIVGNLAS